MLGFEGRRARRDDRRAHRQERRAVRSLARGNVGAAVYHQHRADNLHMRAGAHCGRAVGAAGLAAAAVVGAAAASRPAAVRAVVVPVRVPQGVLPGQRMRVAGPAGQVVEVAVPQGVSAGQVINVQMPAQVAAPVPVVPMAQPVAAVSPPPMASPPAPPPAPGNRGALADTAHLVDMGFSQQQAMDALAACNGSVDAAVEHLLRQQQ